MPQYNVHLYRVLRLVYEGIEACSHEEAAASACGRLTEDADDIDDCDGETFAALVDVAGDEGYEQSRMIDFEVERLRKAAPLLLEALQAIVIAADTDPLASIGHVLEHGSGHKARAAIAAVTAAGRKTGAV